MKKLKLTKKNLSTVCGAVKNWFKNNPYSVECQHYPENKKAYKILGEAFYAKGILSPVKKSIDAGFRQPEVFSSFYTTLGGLEKGAIVIDSDMVDFGRIPSSIELGSKISISPTQIKVYYSFGFRDKLRTVLIFTASNKDTVEPMLANERAMNADYDAYLEWEDDVADWEQGY